MLPEVRQETEGHFLDGTVILGFLTIFQKCQASSTSEATNYANLSMCQRDVMPLVQMRLRPTAFCRVSTGDTDILSSSHMKDEPAFKLLLGNPSFFWVRASRVPFHLKQKTQRPSHIHIPEGKLFLRYLWKFGITLQSKTGHQISSPYIIWSMELSSSCFTEIDVPLDLTWVSQGISAFS